MEYKQPNQNNISIGDKLLEFCCVRGIRELDITGLNENYVLCGRGLTSTSHRYDSSIIQSSSNILIGKYVPKSLIERVEKEL